MAIGEFAVASGLTPKALRLYDDLGLLPPAGVDPATGYRTYAASQLERARLVAALRRVGVPLARIGVIGDLPPAAAAADLAAWWRQVEADTADRRVLVADLLARWRDRPIEEEPMTARVTVSGADGAERGVREEQQDAVVVAGGRAAVADGFGPDGAAASRAVTARVAAADDGSALEGVRAALAGAAAVVGTPGASGTTATALCCDGERVGVAHLGDSRAYLLRQGVLTLLTHDHTWVRSLVDEGRLTPEEAAEHPDRARLVRALGDGDPDVHLRRAVAGDRYLLCTDGVSAVLDEAVLAGALAGGAPAEAVAGLLAAVRSAGAPDNAACAVLDLVASEPAA
ncbi:MerR family transcriptional regulator [Actinomycetospora sp. TBRC 11914]|nr:MerR family transcriptional regulator [Actinomycetospora sp. TBRC 11914]